MSQSSSAPANNTAMKALLGQFASAILHFGQKNTMAGDEVTAKEIVKFNEAMGVPVTPADKNTLLGFAKITASADPASSENGEEDYASIPGDISGNFAACHQLRDHLENRLASMSQKRKKQLTNQSKKTVNAIIPLLDGDKFAIKFVHTLAALGVFSVAGWLLWSAEEGSWKVGSWGVVVMGAIRVIGNLLYNDAESVKQTWKMVFVHVGLGAVGYLMEILNRAHADIPKGTSTTIATDLAGLIPLLAFYFKDLRNAGHEFFANREHKRTGPASNTDIDLLRPITNRLQAYINTSKSVLGDKSTKKPGNRTAAVAKKGQNETQRLVDMLNLDVAPADKKTWGEFLVTLLKEAAKKSPSILYALFTGIFLLVAAQGDLKAQSDASVLAAILFVEVSRGIADGDLTSEQMAYRILLLTLGRFFSIFFFALPKIVDRIRTGRTDLFDREPQLAELMAHLGAVCITLLGIWVIPTFSLIPRLIKRCGQRARRARAIQDAAGEDNELGDTPGGASQAFAVPKAIDLGDDVPELWDDEDEDDEELNKAEDLIMEAAAETFGAGIEEVEPVDRKDGKNSFIYMMGAAGLFANSPEATPELLEAMGREY